MTTFVMGHGNYSGPDTFVPRGRRVGIYAGVDTLLAITVGMAVVAREDGYESVTTFGADDEPVPIHNYRIGPLTHTQLQRMRTVDSAKNTIVYIGYRDDFPGETQLCTDIAGCALLGRHACAGILGRIADQDIRLAFCLGREIQIQEVNMTLRLPDRPEYAELNKQLQAYSDEAQRWNKLIEANPEKAIADFHKMADNAAEAPKAAFIVAASNKLDQTLFLHDARRQRQLLSPGSFLNYLYGLTESSRTLVVKELRKETAPDASAAASGPERFLAGFFSASTDERRAAWASLSPQDQGKAAKNLLVKHWVSDILPAAQKYAQCAASADQPYGWFEAFTGQSGLSEADEAEAQDTQEYRAAADACLQFTHTAGPAAKLALWKRFGERPELLRLLARSGDGPQEWNAAPARSGARADPLAEWVAQYQAAQARRTPAAAEPQPEPESDSSSSSESSEEDDAGYWDYLDMVNLQAAKRWDEGDTVHVAHQGQQFKFADKTQPAPRSALWSEFTVVKVTLDGIKFTGAILKYLRGPVDQRNFAAYLPRLEPGAKITLSQ